MKQVNDFDILRMGRHLVRMVSQNKKVSYLIEADSSRLQNS